MSKRFSVTLDEATHEMLRKLALEHNLAMSQIINQLVFNFVSAMNEMNQE